MARSWPEPCAADLLEAATRYLSRYAASEAAVVRVLERRIARWQRAAEGEPDSISAQAAAARAGIPAILARLRDAGALNDALFAAAKVRRMARSGRSRRVIEGHLAARGISGDIRQQAIAEHATDDVLSALLTARRRRLGPFRNTDGSESTVDRDMAALARAGFPENIVRQVMRLSHTDATRIVEQATGARGREACADELGKV